ncbi:hypothetical protein [Spirosoma luteum]|uniref:hypothetical protein n=1 Tax=Spirosoma luteum TaxID=431553 RepID=UPI00035F7ED1|nr:hypothetical protein [Spirosoma luteum]
MLKQYVSSGISRLTFLGVFIGLAAVLLLSAGFFKPVEKSKPAKPNVLFILVDDLGWRDLDAFGSSFYCPYPVL